MLFLIGKITPLNLHIIMFLNNLELETLTRFALIFFFFETKIYWLYSFFKVVSSMRLGQKVYIEKKGKMLSVLRDSAPTVAELVYAVMVLRCFPIVEGAMTS